MNPAFNFKMKLFMYFTLFEILQQMFLDQSVNLSQFSKQKSINS